MKYWGREAGLGAYTTVIILSTRGVLGQRWPNSNREREHNSSAPGGLMVITMITMPVRDATINIYDR
jgi:hypothetical protein